MLVLVVAVVAGSPGVVGVNARRSVDCSLTSSSSTSELDDEDAESPCKESRRAADIIDYGTGRGVGGYSWYWVDMIMITPTIGTMRWLDRNCYLLILLSEGGTRTENENTKYTSFERLLNRHPPKIHSIHHKRYLT